MRGADGLHDNVLYLYVCLKARGVVPQLQAFIVHLNDAGREVL